MMARLRPSAISNGERVRNYVFHFPVFSGTIFFLSLSLSCLFSLLCLQFVLGSALSSASSLR